MPQSFKRLGAINPTANTQTNVYVIPAATEAVISTVTICNQSASNVSYSLIAMTAGEFTSPAPTKTFIVRGATVPAADTIVLTLGLTMNAGSILSANTNNSNVSIIAFGSELT
jgi:hypothetical protein